MIRKADALLFFVLLALLSILSYANPNPILRLILLFSSLFVCFIPPLQNPTAECHVPPPGLHNWIWVAFVALGLRLAFLGSFQRWPSLDDSMHGFIALDLSRHWRWDFFLIFNQTPPLYHWLHAIFFKCVDPSLTSLYLFPAAISIATIPAVYYSAKVWLPQNRAELLAALWAISFWPTYTGRFDVPQVLVLFWQVMSFGWIGLWVRNLGRKHQNLWTIGTGVWIGLGFGIHYQWPFIYPLLALLAYLKCPPSFRRSALINLALVTGVPLVPMTWVVWTNGDFGHYLLQDTGWKHGLDVLTQVREGFRYPAAAFWGVSSGWYRPVWGGFFNPLLAALSWIGLTYAFRTLRANTAAFLLVGLILGFLPGFLTCPAEYLRSIHVLPILLLAALLGLEQVTERMSFIRPSRLITILLLISATLDSIHLNRCRNIDCANDITLGQNIPARQKAFEIIQEQVRVNGSGRVLSQLAPDPEDTSLTLACLSLPITTCSNASWTAVLIEKAFADELHRRYPNGQVHSLEPDKPGLPGSGLSLWIGEMTPDGSLPESWNQADQDSTQVVRSTIAHRERMGHTQILDALEALQPNAVSDPLLGSVIQMRIAHYHHQIILASSVNRSLQGDLERKNFVLREAAKRTEALKESYGMFPTELCGVQIAETDRIISHIQLPTGIRLGK